MLVLGSVEPAEKKSNPVRSDFGFAATDRYFHLLLLIQPSNEPNRVENAKKKVNEKDQDILDQKKKMRAQTAAQVEKRKVVEETVGDLYEFIDKLHAELLAAKATVKEAGKEFKS